MPDPIEDTKAEVQADLDVLIDRATKRLENERAIYRAYAQNLDVFVQDYTAMMAAQFEAIEGAEKTLHNLHSMKVGRPLEPSKPKPISIQEQAPTPPAHMTPKIEQPSTIKEHVSGPVIEPPTPQISVKQELGKVESEEQAKLRAHFEAAPSIAPGYPVTPPPYAVTGPIGTTWSYKAGTDWGPGDPIDDKGHRHVHGRLCEKGHPNPLTRSDCVACKIEMNNPKPEERRYRIYDMATGDLLSDVAEFPKAVAETGTTVTVGQMVDLPLPEGVSLEGMKEKEWTARIEPVEPAPSPTLRDDMRDDLPLASLEITQPIDMTTNGAKS